MLYRTGQWDCDTLGNHRAVIAVDAPAEAVAVEIDWRRRDRDAADKDIVVICAATGERVANVFRREVNREFGRLVFQADHAGEYYVYYLPWELAGKTQFRKDFFTGITYNTVQDTSEPAWLTQHGQADLTSLPAAKVVAIEAINDFHSFYPMEVIATEDEVTALGNTFPGEAMLVFAEDRTRPIRMTDDLPQCWIERGPSMQVCGEARRGECYAFQLGVYARRDLDDLQVEITDDAGPYGVPVELFSCINMGGTDWLGQEFERRVDVPAGRAQAMWCYVEVPVDIPAGEFESTLIISAEDGVRVDLPCTLVVRDEIVEDGGDSQPELHSRLRWLNSTIGLDEEVFAPYTSVTLKGHTVGVLGRELDFDAMGLPGAIRSSFAPTNDHIDAEPTDVLAQAMRFVVETSTGQVQWTPGEMEILQHTTGGVMWQTTATAEGMTLSVRAKMECDGYTNYWMTLTADREIDTTDMALEIPIRGDASKYFMGMGLKGQRRPASADWKWQVESLGNQFWTGLVNAGLVCKLKHKQDDWAISHMAESGLYQDWSNGGAGGMQMRETEDGTVLVRGYTGARKVSAGESLQFNFGMLVTPVKTLDKDHWQWRYFHGGGDDPVPPQEYVDRGAKVLNVHHATNINPHINYPFLTSDPIRSYADRVHDVGMMFKIYYTSRELTNYLPELWALRSLNGEAFTGGPGYGDPEALATLPEYRDHTGCAWLCEHLVGGYTAAWHSPLSPGVRDAAIETTGLSRLHNYYIQGLDWLMENCHIDGLYLDGIGYDREVFKRVRKVMQRTRPGALVDFHSGDEFNSNFGAVSACVKYAEHLPYCDSIWFGEGFDYEGNDFDYWLVEVSGIPFGLFGEMLQDGGNKWRGMVYGMTRRLGWSKESPAPIWEVWDEIDMMSADMIGFWVDGCPVRTSDANVKATVYRNKGRTLVALASWADGPVEVTLDIDWQALDIDPNGATITAPAVETFQNARTFHVEETIPVEPNRGWMLFIQ
jgi:hypothetical protein